MMRDGTVRANQWNRRNPVGTKVLYWPTTKAPPVEAVTRSIAWVLASGTAVVSLTRSDGNPGAACSLEHVTRLEDGEPASPSLFDAPAGAAALDEALEQVEEHAAPNWKAAALDVVHLLSATTADFTTEDVWEELARRQTSGTPEPRAMGAIMRQAAKLGWIAGTDRTRKSQLPQQHRRPLAVWRSRIYAAPQAARP